MDAFPILMSIVVLATGIVLVITERQKQLDFDRRFPPITDDEFMALCPPGTNREIALKVRRIISEHLNIEYTRIHPSSRFVEDLRAG